MAKHGEPMPNAKPNAKPEPVATRDEPRPEALPDARQMHVLIDACVGPLRNLLAGLERVGVALDAAAVLGHQMGEMERRRDTAQAEAVTIRQELDADRARLNEDLEKGAQTIAADKRARATEADDYRAKVLSDLETRQAQADARLAQTERAQQELVADQARLQPEIQALHEQLTQYKSELTRLKAAIPV